MLAEMLGELNISHSGATFNSVARRTTTPPRRSASSTIRPYTGAGREGRRGHQGRPARSARRSTSSPGMIIESVDGIEIAPDKDIAAVPQPQGRKNVLARPRRRRARRPSIVVKPVTARRGESAALCALGQAQRRRSRQGEQRAARLRAHSRDERRRVSHDVRGHHGQVRDAQGRRRRHALQRRRRSRRRPRDVPERQEVLRLHDRHARTGYEPNFRWTKPTVAMANEANYSDGHCFAYAYKNQKIGPLIGMPTPGTCTFAGWESLQDGIRWGVPGVGVKDATTGKYLENRRRSRTSRS